MKNTTFLDNLKLKVERLIVLHERLKNENQQLKSDNKKLEKTIVEQKKEILYLNDKVKLLKLAKAAAKEGDDRRQMKLMINDLIREIDSCIAQLNC